MMHVNNSIQQNIADPKEFNEPIKNDEAKMEQVFINIEKNMNKRSKRSKMIMT